MFGKPIVLSTYLEEEVEKFLNVGYFYNLYFLFNFLLYSQWWMVKLEFVELLQ